MSIELRTVFCFLILLNVLASVSVFGVPLPWVGMALSVPVAFALLNRVKQLWVACFLPLTLLATYCVLLNIFYWDQFSVSHPSEATTPYSVYVILRYMVVLNFVAIVTIVFRICQMGGFEWMINLIVNIGMMLACYAIYVYFAQTFGFYELLPRSRLGTGGEEQATTFTYAFHRAMGSFREPSHLAEWLMVPFTLSFIVSPKYFDPRKILIGTVVLMSGSMTGIMSLLMALPVAFVVTHGGGIRLSWAVLKRLLGMIAVFIFMISIINMGLSGLFFEVISDRLFEVINGGVSASNRGYVYEYVENSSIPYFGIGLGNANIEFSATIGSELVSSFLNLYLNILYSSGLLGLIVFFGVISYPIFVAFAKKKYEQRKIIFFILWSYIATLISFSIHSEELTSAFGVSYALLFFYALEAPWKTQLLNKPVLVS